MDTSKNRQNDRYEQTVSSLKQALRVDASFDVLARELVIGGRAATLFFVDGFVKDEIMEKILAFLMSLDPDEVGNLTSTSEFSARYITYVEQEATDNIDQVVTQVLSGVSALVIDQLEPILLLDARTYPVRSVDEPDTDRVLRGSHDGFVETLVFNTALIRRRIRDPRLTMEYVQIGEVSHTDLVLCYMDGQVDRNMLDRLRKNLKNIRIPALSMAQESLRECLVRQQWYNPFPKVRYTERPDAAAAAVLEGRVLIVTDNSAAVMILPTALFDFVQEANDYAFPPLVGSWLRLVRMLVFGATLFLTPLWYAFLQSPETIPPWLDFIRIAEPNAIPLLVQLLIMEVVIDAIKLASLNTPGALNNAFGVVGALILGEFAITAGFFVPEALLYMAVVAVGTFTQPSFELGYAFKLFRVLLLILTALWHWWGFGIGIALMVLAIVTTKTISRTSYLYPLIPFSGKGILRLLFHLPISHDNAG